MWYSIWYMNNVLHNNVYSRLTYITIIGFQIISFCITFVAAIWISLLDGMGQTSISYIYKDILSFFVPTMIATLLPILTVYLQQHKDRKYGYLILISLALESLVLVMSLAKPFIIMLKYDFSLSHLNSFIGVATIFIIVTILVNLFIFSRALFIHRT